MVTRKSDKELAFLSDLFVAPDWGERFSSLVDEHVELPEKGDVLYVVCGTGGHVMTLQERASNKLEFLALDESEECVELARAKAAATNQKTLFCQTKVDQLPLTDNHFDLVLGDGSMITPQRVAKMLDEMVRVARPGATVALHLTTASSFGEFFSIYWEAIHNSGLVDHEADVEHLITELLTVSEVEDLADGAGLEDISSQTRVEEFDYDSGESFFNSPLISDFLMPNWLQSVPEASRERVAQEIAQIINEERHEAEFALSVKATLIVGRKSRFN